MWRHFRSDLLSPGQRLTSWCWSWWEAYRSTLRPSSASKWAQIVCCCHCYVQVSTLWRKFKWFNKGPSNKMWHYTVCVWRKCHMNIHFLLFLKSDFNEFGIKKSFLRARLGFKNTHYFTLQSFISLKTIIFEKNATCYQIRYFKLFFFYSTCIIRLQI